MQNNTEADDDSNERKELADRHEGASATRERIQGAFEYNVVLTDEQVEELPDRLDALEFAKRIAVSRLNKELDPTFTVSESDALAEEEIDYAMNGERRFTVLARFEQND